jgi:hypothetical protein
MPHAASSSVRPNRIAPLAATTARGSNGSSPDDLIAAPIGTPAHIRKFWQSPIGIAPLLPGRRSAWDISCIDTPMVGRWPRGLRMNCEEKNRLVMEYEDALAKLSTTVTKLRENIGVSTKEAYALLDRAANEDRTKSEQARLALAQHVAAHRC